MKFNPKYHIDITGCDLVALVKKAYELSVPRGLGFLHFQQGTLTDEEAKSIIRDAPEGIIVRMDYVKGRAVKLNVYRCNGRLFTQSSWYDHTDEAFKELLSGIADQAEAA